MGINKTPVIYLNDKAMALNATGLTITWKRREGASSEGNLTTGETSSAGIAGATGSTGAAAKSVDITATTQVFKSTDGGTTFSPDTIKLTPLFQGGISFGKWQYSINGGTSWADVASGSNGLTIASGVLTIAKTCSLFTNSLTALSFKCISNNSSFFDVMTVLKLYDVTDIEIGGKNYVLHKPDSSQTLNGITASYSDNVWTLKGTNTKTDANWGIANWIEREQILEPGSTYTLSTTAPLPTGIYLGLNTKNSTGSNISAGGYLYGPNDTITFVCPNDSTGYVNGFFGIRSSCTTIDCTFKIKLEKGNKATDWTPAPEDIDAEFKIVHTSYENVKHTADENAKFIQDKAYQNDIYSVTDKDGNPVRKTLIDTLVQSTLDISGINRTVSSVQTDIQKKFDGTIETTLSKKIAEQQQSLDGFKTTVSNTYSTKTELSNSQKELSASDVLNQALAQMATSELLYTDPTLLAEPSKLELLLAHLLDLVTYSDLWIYLNSD